MITLYTFGPGFGLPDPSPFVMKGEMLLKLAKLPYQTNTRGFMRAPKGKLPFIDVDEVLVRDVTLPPTIKDAIERKLRQEQESLEYEFRLEKADKEAQKVRIEAQGKADANRILSASLNSMILQDKGIEATLQLSQSPNAKVVIIGSGKDGMPIILGNN
jgi:regulator of protease activity HflC (stomatin/prohibitin superfamily)